MDCYEVVEGLDCELDFIRFKRALEVFRNQFVPMKKNYNKKCKWVNRSVTKCRRAKFKAWEKYKTDKTEANMNHYKTNSFYAYVGSKQRTKDKVGPLKKV